MQKIESLYGEFIRFNFHDVVLKVSCCRFKSDHNEDDSIKVTEAWINSTSHLYHKIQFYQEGAPVRRKSEHNLFHWSDERYLDVIRMKEEGFAYGRKMLADYILVRVVWTCLTTDLV